MDNLELIQKIVLIVTGVIAILLKIKSYFSTKNQKQDFKQDIEILELLKKQGNTNTKALENKIDSELGKIYDKDIISSSGFTGLLIGLTFFIGFGRWSIDIYNSHSGFNAWIILTSFFSAGGISMMLMDTTRVTRNEPFFKIGFYERPNMRFGFFLALISGFTLFVLIVKLDSFSFWEFLCGLIFLYGLFMIGKNIRKIS